MIGVYKMIRYSKTITLEQYRDDWRLRTDRGQEYLITQINITNQRNPVTDWWNLQNQSTLRYWQKDAVFLELTRNGYSEDFTLWLVYRQGQGYNQPHDIMIFYHHRLKCWILSTAEHLWIQPAAMIGCVFDKEDALEIDITDDEQRRTTLYPLLDGMREYL